MVPDTVDPVKEVSQPSHTMMTLPAMDVRPIASSDFKNEPHKEPHEEARGFFQNLSDYDDVLSDILLDTVFLGFKTHKMNSDYFDEAKSGDMSGKPLNRIYKDRINRESIAKVVLVLIKDLIVKQRNLEVASLLLSESIQGNSAEYSGSFPQIDAEGWNAFSAFKPFLSGRDPVHVSDFREHVKRYFAMYLPNAGYEIMRTDRYKNTGKVEACIIATRQWNAGDEIRHCSGVIAELTEKDEENIASRDFSVMFSTRKGCMCLFLGPARFVNHDCRANCKFISLGASAICFKVLKPIEAGEEITTYYGDDYFGEGNNECLCASCERLKMGGFSSKGEEQAMAELIGDGEKPIVTKLRKTELRSESWTFVMKKFLALETEDEVAPDTDMLGTRHICQICKKLPQISSLPEEHLQNGMFALLDDSRGRCCRCARHFKVFNVEWPNRKAINRKVGPIHKFDQDPSLLETPEDLFISYDEYHLGRKPFLDPDELKMCEHLRSILGKVPVSVEHSHMVVFVHPGDYSTKRWWPALLIPPDETDDTMPELEEDDLYTVTYLEDHTFENVKLSDIRLFDPSHEPFLTFQKEENFDEDPAVKRALRFIEDGKIPKKNQWKKFNGRLTRHPKPLASIVPCFKSCCRVAKPTTKVEIRWKAKNFVNVASLTFGACFPKNIRNGISANGKTAANMMLIKPNGNDGHMNFNSRERVRVKRNNTILEDAVERESWMHLSSDSFSPEDSILILAGCWFIGNVITVNAEARECLVRYAGWQEKWNETKPYKDLRRISTEHYEAIRLIPSYFKGLTKDDISPIVSPGAVSLEMVLKPSQKKRRGDFIQWNS